MPDDIRSGKSKSTLDEMGGIDRMCQLLKSSKTKGISTDKHEKKEREKVFGDNKPVEKESKSFFQLMLDALEDTTLIILICAALISLVVGVIENPEEGWMEGVAILIAVAIVVLVTAINDYGKELQFRKLSAEAKEHKVNVIRDGEERHKSFKKLLVGDIVRLSSGDVIPADGIVVFSESLVADESSLTGEADPQKKGFGPNESMFLISGSLLAEGTGRMLVCAVGKKSSQGTIGTLVNVEDSDTPLQRKLNRITEGIGKLGLLVAVITFLVLLTYIIIDAASEGWGTKSWEDLISAFIIGVTIIVVAVPEGLPLAVTLSLAFSVNQMKKQNNLVRNLEASETMGQATCICSDKTGTLTKNDMEVTAMYIGGKKQEEVKDLKFDEKVREILGLSCCHNTEASITYKKQKKTFTGSRTELALLELAKQLGYKYEEVRDPEKILARVPFSSTIKRMETAVNHEEGILVMVKGATEVVLDMCTSAINEKGEVEDLSSEELSKIKQEIIPEFASRALRTLTLAYKKVDPDFELKNENGEVNMENLEKDLVLLAVCGIEDPIRPEVPSAVERCMSAGISVRMVTGDNPLTATAIARRCHILPGDYQYSEDKKEVMLGEEFRSRVKGLKEDKSCVGDLEEFEKIIKGLRVLARSSPEDKFILVTGLRQLNQVVAVTGDGSNDAPALKKANVGFSMHISGTQLAQEASDIILLDDNFASIVTAALWGRNIYDCIAKFIQFQLTVNIVALILSFIGACVLKEAPLTAVQMLWVNLIMDTFAALALATEPPNQSLLDRDPVKHSDTIVTTTMMKLIIGQSFYQIVWLLVILFLGPSLFGVESSWGKTEWSEEGYVHLTIFFNTFVFLQVFNEINCRKVRSNEFNVFKNFFNNYLFIFIVGLTVVVQIFLVSFGGEALRLSPLSWDQHLYCILIGVGGIVFGLLVRLLPDKLFACFRLSEEPVSSKDADHAITSRLRRRTTKSVYGANRSFSQKIR